MWMSFAVANDRGQAKEVGFGRIEFQPHRFEWIVIPLSFIGPVWSAVRELQHVHPGPLAIWTACAVGFGALAQLFGSPGTIVITPDGLEQAYWIRGEKRLRWSEVVKINASNWSNAVTILGPDGTRIVYTTRLADRPRFLRELELHRRDRMPKEFAQETVSGMKVREIESTCPLFVDSAHVSG